ncbi:hypothetical protein GQ53DRAFT_861343 [Thozetella sp. PMI_491]|nr:hypothetical protein GQ53DRAFT_861343 [Thozetella sp. PMI_491]
METFQETVSSRWASSLDLEEIDIADTIIELDYLPPSCNGTQSTDNLLRDSESTSQLENDIETVVLERRPSPNAKKPGPIVPDYKPITLRWFFQVFLMLCIGGILGFLEYEIRTLPMPDFDALSVGGKSVEQRGIRPAKQIRHAAGGSEQGSSNPLVPGSTLSIAPVTAQFNLRDIASHPPLPTAAAVAIALPKPDPRKPEEVYPGGSGASTWFRWDKPIWLQYTTSIMYQDVALEYGYMLESLYIEEFIPTSYTDDPSWCKVYPWTNWDGSPQLYPPEQLTGSGHAVDEGCVSVINGIYAYNNMAKQTWSDGSTHPESTEGRPFDKTVFPSDTTTLTEAPVHPVTWVLPEQAQGELLFPLEARALPQSGWQDNE